MAKPWFFFKTSLGVAGCLLTSTACVPAVIGAGALTGASIAEERGVGVSFGDAGIRSSIHAKVMRYSLKVFNALNFKVKEGKVLIAGSTDTQEEQLEVLRLVWTVSGVREVENEIQIGQKGTVGDYMRDTWITTQMKSQMLFNKDIQSRNYSVDTVGGVVYIMGIAQNQDELNCVTDVASHIRGVEKVISYVRIKSEGKGFINPEQPDQGSGAPIVQAAPDAQVHVEPLLHDTDLKEDIGDGTSGQGAAVPQPITPPSF